MFAADSDVAVDSVEKMHWNGKSRIFYAKRCILLFHKGLVMNYGEMGQDTLTPSPFKEWKPSVPTFSMAKSPSSPPLQDG